MIRLAALLLISPAALGAEFTAETARALTDEQLCHNYAAKPSNRTETEFRALVWSEILERGLFTEEHASAVRAGELQLGMPAIAIRCVLGPPSSMNRTRTASVERVQWVYRRAGRYVYTADGVIVALQD